MKTIKVDRGVNISSFPIPRMPVTSIQHSNDHGFAMRLIHRLGVYFRSKRVLARDNDRMADIVTKRLREYEDLRSQFTRFRADTFDDLDRIKELVTKRGRFDDRRRDELVRLIEQAETRTLPRAVTEGAVQ